MSVFSWLIFLIIGLIIFNYTTQIVKCMLLPPCQSLWNEQFAVLWWQVAAFKPCPQFSADRLYCLWAASARSGRGRAVFCTHLGHRWGSERAVGFWVTLRGPKAPILIRRDGGSSPHLCLPNSTFITQLLILLRECCKVRLLRRDYSNPSGVNTTRMHCCIQLSRCVRARLQFGLLSSTPVVTCYNNV